MVAPKRSDWLVPTLTLTVAWAVTTVALVATTMATKVTLPGFVAKAGPFILAGFATGRFVSVSERRPKIIAAAVLAIVAAAAWTSFTFATTDIGTNKALGLFAASLPVMLVASLWAYFGMFLGGRGSTSIDASQEDPELDDLERELRNEIADERGPRA